MSSKLHLDGIITRCLGNACEVNTGMMNLQVTLCEPHLSNLEIVQQ